MITAADITDADIRAFKAESRAVDDRERVRACNAALGLPTGDGALGLLDQATCRARVAELIIRERTPGTTAARVTADTISDKQIRVLRDRMYDRVDRGVDSKDDRETRAICESALNEMCHPQRRREARARCAEILNARAVTT